MSGSPITINTYLNTTSGPLPKLRDNGDGTLTYVFPHKVEFQQGVTGLENIETETVIGESLELSNNTNQIKLGNDTNHHLILNAPVTDATGGDTTLTFPLVTDTVVTKNYAQTLTNKTLVDPVIQLDTLTLTGTTNQLSLGNDTDNHIIINAPVSDAWGGDVTLTLPARTDTLVTLDGNETLTNKTIEFPTSGGTPTSLNYYEEKDTAVSFAGAFSGNVNLKFTRIGRKVTLTWPDHFGTFTANAKFGASILDSRFVPSSTVYSFIPAKDNGTNVVGLLKISSAGGLTISNGVTDGNFTSGTSGGFYGGSIPYTV